MLNPYKIVEETETTITYQYNSIYSWTLIAILLLFVLSMLLNIFWLQLTATFLIVLYFGVKLVAGKVATTKIRQALKSGSIELSGGKYSFSNPLTAKVPKNA